MSALFLKLIYYGAGAVVHLRLLKFFMNIQIVMASSENKVKPVGRRRWTTVPAPSASLRQGKCFFASTVYASFLKLIYHRASMALHLLLLICSKEPIPERRMKNEMRRLWQFSNLHQIFHFKNLSRLSDQTKFDFNLRECFPLMMLNIKMQR